MAKKFKSIPMPKMKDKKKEEEMDLMSLEDEEMEPMEGDMEEMSLDDMEPASERNQMLMEIPDEELIAEIKARGILDEMEEPGMEMEEEPNPEEEDEESLEY